jgi:hypothetical protein
MNRGTWSDGMFLPPLTFKMPADACGGGFIAWYGTEHVVILLATMRETGQQHVRTGN